MGKFIKKVEPVDAVQWKVSMDIPSVKKHIGCNYRMCPICGGDAETTPIYYVDLGNDILYIRDGNWIVTEDNGKKSVYDDKRFKELYEPLID
jgi:hypothetical protein